MISLINLFEGTILDNVKKHKGKYMVGGLLLGATTLLGNNALAKHMKNKYEDEAEKAKIGNNRQMMDYNIARAGEWARKQLVFGDRVIHVPRRIEQ